MYLTHSTEVKEIVNMCKDCKCARLRKTLQEIKAIAEMDICSNCIAQKQEINCQCLADTILQLITKAESEG